MLATSQSKTVAADAEQCLEALSPDLSVGLIHDIVMMAYSHVEDLTRFAPSNSKGVELHLRATEYLRERLSNVGWYVDNSENVSSIVSAGGNLRIAYSTAGGPDTGVITGPPTLSERGRGTLRLAGCKRVETLPIPGLEEFASRSIVKLDNAAFWYLLMHIDESSEEIRMELSEPAFYSDGSQLGWKNRIMLPPISLCIARSAIDVSEAPMPVIKVARKAS